MNISEQKDGKGRKYYNLRYDHNSPGVLMQICVTQQAFITKLSASEGIALGYKRWNRKYKEFQ